jgi:hypothetical protein
VSLKEIKPPIIGQNVDAEILESLETHQSKQKHGNFVDDLAPIGQFLKSEACSFLRR